VLKRKEKVMLRNRRTITSPFWGLQSSLRFLPNAVDDAIKEGETDLEKDKVEIDKQRQRADQEAANARRAREQAQSAQEQLQALQAESQAMKDQLAKLEAQAAEKEIKVPDLNAEDYEGSDKALVDAIQGLKASLVESRKEIGDLRKSRAKYEADLQAQREQEARNEVYNSLLSDLDDEYGAQYRNAAVTRFNELVADGKVPQGNAAKATRMMEKCYEEVVAADRKGGKDKSSVQLDTGSGGGSAPALNRTKLTPGSLEEVSAQVKAASNTS